MVTQLRNEMSGKSLKMIFSGFGVGLSWGSMYIETGAIPAELVET
jgi:hypothetical protein